MDNKEIVDFLNYLFVNDCLQIDNLKEIIKCDDLDITSYKSLEKLASIYLKKNI